MNCPIPNFDEMLEKADYKIDSFIVFLNELPEELLKLQLEYYLKSKILKIADPQHFPLICKLFTICHELGEIGFFPDSSIIGTLVESYFDLVSSPYLYDAIIEVFFNCFQLVKNKPLIFLRITNKALKRIPRLNNNQSAKLSLIIAGYFSLAERSGVNLRGDFSTIDQYFISKVSAFGSYSIEKLKESIRIDSATEKTSSALHDLELFFADIAKVFNEFAVNFHLIATERDANLLLKVADCIYELYDSYITLNASSSTCTVPVLMNSPESISSNSSHLVALPSCVDCELFRMIFYTKSFSVFLLSSMAFLLQSLIYAKEIQMPSVVLSATMQIACESRLPSYLTKFYSLISKMFGDSYCHNLKLAMYSEKCRLKWKINSCPASERSELLLDDVEIFKNTSFVFKDIMPDDEIRQLQDVLLGNNLGSPELNKLWSRSSIELNETTHSFSVDQIFEQFKEDSSCSTDMMFIWKSMRLMWKSGMDLSGFIGKNPVTEFASILETFSKKNESSSVVNMT